MTAPLWLLSGIAMLGAIGFAIPDDYIQRDAVRALSMWATSRALLTVSAVLALAAWGLA